MEEKLCIKWLKDQIFKLNPDNKKDQILIDIIQDIINDVEAMEAIRFCIR